jgi:homocysteine S-methyltransferase
MDFSQFIASGAPAIAEGAIVERVRRDPSLPFDPHILNGGLIYDPAGRSRLAAIHGDYIRSARDCGLPILIGTDTWRCSQKLIDASPFRGLPVNQDNVAFLRDLRASQPAGPPIFLGGLIGPSGDAYQPSDSLSRQAASVFHRPQIEALASSGVDYLFLATAPSVEEALGVADQMTETGLPYMLSFVIRRNGAVLDGTRLGAAIARIDAEARTAPIGYAVNCVHARVLQSALEAEEAAHPEIRRRLLGFQANTADMEVEDLDNSTDLVGEAPDTFVPQLERLRERFGVRILGGCCGTDETHMALLASRIR